MRQLQKTLGKQSLSSISERAQVEREQYVLADCSGSMSEHCEPGRAKIDGLRDIFTQLRAEGVPFTLVCFGIMGAAIIQEPPDPDGGTPMHLAFEIARNRRAKKVVLISDGMPDSKEAVQREAKALKCPIDIYYVGPRPHPGEVFLRSLAKKSGGQYASTSLARYDTKQLVTEIRQRLALPVMKP